MRLVQWAGGNPGEKGQVTDMEKQYRHGDVFLREVADGVPDAAVIVPRNGDVVLAEGEVTGHAHRIRSPQVALWDAGAQRYLVVEREAELTHEEHGTIVLAPGVYEVVIQREYNYLAEMPRAVAD